MVPTELLQKKRPDSEQTARKPANTKPARHARVETGTVPHVLAHHDAPRPPATTPTNAPQRRDSTIQQPTNQPQRPTSNPRPQDHNDSR